MVRSMLSSEEERDLQAIYLLGVGRFYTYGTLADTKQTKGSMAMNSVLSSVLSSRFNQIMSQALGGNNFIGDFDIQYRLSPRSPFSLKAYNQTNDRYFTQSSLTTQGIGIKFQRDFSRFLELFHRTKNKGKKE